MSEQVPCQKASGVIKRLLMALFAFSVIYLSSAKIGCLQMSEYGLTISACSILNNNRWERLSALIAILYFTDKDASV